jgi:hypothetical protein
MGDVAAADITTQQIVRQAAPPSGMYYGISIAVDAAGNMFVAVVDITSSSSVGPWIQVRKYAPNNTTVLGEWRIMPKTSFRVDDVSLSPRGADLLVAAITHTIGGGPARTRAVEVTTIPNVFVTE